MKTKTQFLKFGVFFLFLISGLSFHTNAKDLKASDQEALENTQSFLKNKSQREAYIKNNPDAQKPMMQMNSMGMGENQKNQVFDISSDVFSELVKNSGGDIEAVKKKLLEAQGNPEAFYKSMDPKSREMIKKLSSELEEKSFSSENLK